MPDSVTKDGLALYYNKGILDKKIFYTNNRREGTSIKYYANGNPEWFICWDFCGDTVFARKYDLVFNVLYESGSMMPHVMVDDRKTNQNHLLFANSFFPHPPKVKIINNCYLFRLTADGKRADTSLPFQTTTFNEWQSICHFVVPVPGDYRFLQVTLITDSSRGNVQYLIKDSIRCKKVVYERI